MLPLPGLISKLLGGSKQSALRQFNEFLVPDVV